MSDLTLFHYPGACSNAAVVALEQAGLDYGLRLVDLAHGEQNGDAYLGIVALGKIPALKSPDGLITENAAILTYIHGLAPEAGLFPADQSPIAMARRQAGLSFVGGNLHPIVRGLSNPQRLTDTDQDGVRSMAKKLAKKSFGFAEQRLADNGGWWLSEGSIIDVYLNWAAGVARNAGFDLSPFPMLDSLRDRLTARPAYARMEEINARAREELAERVPA